MRVTKRRSTWSTTASTLFAVVLGLSLGFCRAMAGSPPPYEARAGLDLATAAAQVWATDAVLIYIENDEPVDGVGAAERWGYLFYSESLDQSRSYSVRDGKIVVARNLDMRFEAPPLASGWIDSHAALEVADKSVGLEFCKKQGGRLRTMLLMRGAFQDEHPDQTTWTVIYTAPHAPALFVMVDATAGKVRRTWRG